MKSREDNGEQGMWVTDEDATRDRKGCSGRHKQGQYEMSWGTERQQWGV